MTLQELLDRHPGRPTSSVPDWMLGYYKRLAISFANGQTDTATHVCWLQSRNFTIDLRLPLETEQAPDKPLAAYTADELQVLASYEGWEALSVWDGERLAWHTDTSLQMHNRWPEPALLSRVGNCMIEFAPSGAYVEDWRLQPSRPGPLIGLRLIEERDLASGAVRHRGGGLIVCGEYAALVLGRPAPMTSEGLLRDLALDALGNGERLAALFAFETSVAQGSLEQGYSVALSTRAGRVGRPLIALDGFEYLPDRHQLSQHFEQEGAPCERLFAIDTLEACLPFDQATGFTPEAEAWYGREAPTLTRYNRTLR